MGSHSKNVGRFGVTPQAIKAADGFDRSARLPWVLLYSIADMPPSTR